MRLSLKIFFIWAAVIVAYYVCLWIFPHGQTTFSTHLNQFIQSFLCVVTLFIFLKEPNRKNKFIFFNFLIFFSLSLLTLVYDFIGWSFWKGADYKYARHIYYVYVNIGYSISLAVAVVYLVSDSLFRDFKVYQKYLGTLIVVIGFSGAWFYPQMENPVKMYASEDLKQWKNLDTKVAQMKAAGMPVTPVQVASNLTLHSYKDGQAIGDLYPEQNLKRIEELMPYLEGSNFSILLLKPLYLSIIQTDVLIVFFIFLFFAYQYKKDPPQGAYIDKIMFLVLLLQSMDILHNWGYIKSVEWSSLTDMFSAGQYITVFTELMMVLFFSLRLRFITSVQGEFYETELATNPHQVSRWRDWVDNMVLSQFFNFKIFNGRLFQNPSGK